MQGDARERAARLRCWSGPVEPQPVGGGITNANFAVADRGARYFVRIGADLPVHGVLRSHEAAASRAAAAAGLSPEVIHVEPGALVLRFVEGRPLAPEDVRKPEQLERILPLVLCCHRELARHLHGPGPSFRVFDVLRGYARTLREDGSRLVPELPRLLSAAQRLEAAVGPDAPVFGHNDLLAANLLDDGRRLWLVDWEYAGWGSRLFDLAGLASNSALPAEQEEWLLACYFGSTPDASLRRRYQAMKCASLLREALWSAVSEPRSELAFDYGSYTAEYLARFERAFEVFGAR